MYQELGCRCKTSLAMEDVGKRSAAPTLTAREKAHMQKLIWKNRQRFNTSIVLTVALKDFLGILNFGKLELKLGYLELVQSIIKKLQSRLFRDLSNISGTIRKHLHFS